MQQNPLRSPCDADRFRRLAGRFATGICVVLSHDAEGVAGLTVNSFTAVSLDPLMLLFCPRRGSASARRIVASGRFSVNVLGEPQLDVSRHFAGPRSGLEPEISEDGEFVWLPASLAVFACEVVDVHAAGDHDIVLGQVCGGLGPELAGAPLLYHEGRYARIEAPVMARPAQCAP